MPVFGIFFFVNEKETPIHLHSRRMGVRSF